MHVTSQSRTKSEPSKMAETDKNNKSSGGGSSAVVLDFQCFKNNDNELILKEVAIVELDTGVLLLHHIACPPFERGRLNEERLRESYWSTKHCHGLRWEQGDIPYHVLVDKLWTCLHRRDAVYIKGSEKRDYVRRHLMVPGSGGSDAVVDLADLGCGSLTSLSGPLSVTSLRCNRHKTTKSRCALENTVNLRNWVRMAAPHLRRRPPQPHIGRDEVDSPSTCTYI